MMKKTLLILCALVLCLLAGACSRSVIVDTSKYYDPQTMQQKIRGAVGVTAGLSSSELFPFDEEDMKKLGLEDAEFKESMTDKEVYTVIYYETLKKLEKKSSEASSEESSETPPEESIEALLDELMLAAVLAEDTSLIRNALDKSSNINGTITISELLVSATIESKVESVKFLLEAGADPNIGGELDAPLALAIKPIKRGNRIEDAQIIEMLLKAGATQGLETAVVSAAFDCTACLDRMINAGIELGPHYKNTPVLALVVAGGDVYSIKRVIDAGVDVNAVSNGGNTALMFATLGQEDAAVMLMLLEAGADPNLNNVNQKGKTLEDLAAESSCTTCRDYGFEDKSDIIRKAKAKQIIFKYKAH